MRSAFILILTIGFVGCGPTKKIVNHSTADSIFQLKFLGEYDIANGKQFKGTTVGGLSGIDYDSTGDIYYLISDDRSVLNPARFYTAKIYVDEKGIDSVEFVDVFTFLQKDGKPYPNAKSDPLHTPDPEAIRYDQRKKELVWSSEGERIVRSSDTILEDPAIIAIESNGRYKDSFAIPVNMQMHSNEKGPRQNGVFEGMTFSDDYKYLYTSVEEPLYEDGPRAGSKDSSALIRIIKFDADQRLPVAQYYYRIGPVAYPSIPTDAYKINGVPDILWLGNERLLVIERSFSTGRPGCTVKIFEADLKTATELTSGTLMSESRPASKKLILNMDELGRYIDNVEGVTIGPTLANGHRTLIFVSDDNFSATQKTQFMLFEVIPQ